MPAGRGTGRAVLRRQPARLKLSGRVNLRNICCSPDIYGTRGMDSRDTRKPSGQKKTPCAVPCILHRGSVLNIGISHAYPSSHCICGECPGGICLCSLPCGLSSGTPIHRWGIRALLFHRPFLLFRISGEHLQAPPALLPVFRFTAGTPCSIRSLDSLLSSHPYLFLCLKYTKFCEICQRKLCTIFNFNFRVTCTKTAADFPCKMCAFMLDKSPRDTV